MASAEPTPAAARLAERLRELREGAGLTQTELGQALGGADDSLSPTTISNWENAATGRPAPRPRLEAYARLFCTPRSFEGGKAQMVDVADLVPAEHDRMEELRRELLGLRGNAMSPGETRSSPAARSVWHFPDGAPVTLVCSRLPDERRPPSANPDELNYVRLSGLADLDSLIDIYGAVSAYNPDSLVSIKAAQELARADVANHLVLIGGLTWEAVTPLFSRIFPIPIDAGDPADRGAIVVHDRDGGEREFPYTRVADELIEDVGFFARGKNPSAPRRTLTICGGITTRGVRGAARCFIDWEMHERNYDYLKRPQFPDGSTYCIVMRVPVLNNDPLTPDLSREENRLFEWCDASTEVG